MPEMINSIVDLRKYLGTKDRPVSTGEMTDFWHSLSTEEKEEFKSTKLPE